MTAKGSALWSENIVIFALHSQNKPQATKENGYNLFKLNETPVWTVQS